MLTLALPSRGRLAEHAEHLIRNLGVNLERTYRSLQCEDPTAKVKVVFVHHKDAGMLVERGYVDLAITAQDILAEIPSDVSVLAQLGFGKCQIVVAVPEVSSVNTVHELDGQIIATSYPHLTQMWFTRHQIHCDIINLHGSIEVMPKLGLASGIVDTYQTGVSARTHNLRVIDTIMCSQAVLIGNINSPLISDSANFINRIASLASPNKS